MRNLRPEFLEGIEHLRTLVDNFAPKMLNGKHITGEQLCTLTESLCSVLNSDALPNLDDVWTLVAAQSRQCALQGAKEAFSGAASINEGLSAAYATYKAGILEDGLSGDDTFQLLSDLVKGDVRDSVFEQKYIDVKRECEILSVTASTQHNESESRLRDSESNLASAHRKVARLVDDSLAAQVRLQELESAAALPASETTGLIDVLEGLQKRHKEVKTELAEKKRVLEDVVQTVHAQDRTIAEHANRMASERKLRTDERARSTDLEVCVSDLKSSLHQSTTDVAIWRTRYEDIVSRTNKKRKMNEDSYTELITLTSEVNFLRTRHEEDVGRIQQYIHGNVTWAQQVQSLQVKLALEIGK
jgi:hypothetical protein